DRETQLPSQGNLLPEALPLEFRWRMIVVIVQPDLPIGHHLLMLGQPAEVIIPAIADLLCLVRVDTHRGIDKRVPVSQLDGGPTGGEIAADRHKVLHAGYARSRDHGIAVAV